MGPGFRRDDKLVCNPGSQPSLTLLLNPYFCGSNFSAAEFMQ
jgi:hypothetical protein